MCGVCDLKTAERVIFDLCIYNCNMEKYRKMWYDGSEEEIKKNKFLVALDLPLEDLEEMVKGDAHMEEFKDKMKKLNQNEDIVNFLHSEEVWKKLDRSVASEELKKAQKESYNQGIEQGIGEGIKKGIEQGEMRNKIENAKNCLKKGIDVKLISKITGLDEHQILDIKNEG